MSALKPNVVVMLADNVGVGGLSCYGGTIPTPRLDGLAAEAAPRHNLPAQLSSFIGREREVAEIQHYPFFDKK